MTIKDIARESGYSVGTVSRVLNNHPDVSEKARKKVMEVVDKYHFRLNNNAKHLKQQINSGIVIIVKGTRNMLFASMVETLQKLIREKEYACVIDYIEEDDHEVEQALQVCREKQPLGIMFLGGNLANFKERFAEVDIPCVLVTNSTETVNFENLSSVSIDDTVAAEKAIEHLVSLGHKRIGIIGGEMKEMKHSNPAKSRYDGCVSAFQRLSLPFDAEKQFEATHFTMEGGYQAMGRLMDKMSDLTAVFVMSDVMALGAIRAVRDRGLRVPDDISVIGFDGIEMGQYLVPKLTTIQQPSFDLAERCVDILLQCICENKPAVNEIIPFYFIEGESAKVL
jgi:LacI family transcriptional regulator